MKKTVTILHNSDTVMFATNAKSRNVWKETSPGTFEFSHVEKLTPTHTMEEFIGKPAKQTNTSEEK